MKYKKISFNFEIKDKDEPEAMTWHDAMKKFNGKGKGKWRLPTKEELNLMYKNKDIVGGFTYDYYWSSSEYDASSAWIQYFNNGNQYTSIKYYPTYVRCVRSF